MAVVPSVLALNAVALVASNLPGLNSPIPLYAIVAADTFLPLTIPTSWGEFSPKYEVQLSDYPQERGAFALYNKVRRPQVVNVMLIKTGSDVARFAWLAAIQQQEASNPLQLYNLISPQGVFLDYTLSAMSYETRPDRGSNKLYLNLTFTEVPQIQSDTTDNPAQPKAGPVADIGRLFTNAATAAETALANAQTFLTGG